MRRIALAVIAASAALAMAGPAAASPPERFEFDFQESDTVNCSTFNPSWTFNDDFVDYYHIQGKIWFDDDGNPINSVEHVEHTSNDVNSVTGLTLHEHNHFLVKNDFVTRTGVSSGAINIMERRGAGQVIHNTGHRLMAFDVDEPLVVRGPSQASDADFCAAVAP